MEIGLLITPLVHVKIIKEALSRVGIANKQQKMLYPSCYLTVINGNYVIAHFKELFPILNGGSQEVSDTDISRRNTIITLLCTWGLITADELQHEDRFVFVLKRSLKDSWTIYHKINLNTLNNLESEGINI